MATIFALLSLLAPVAPGAPADGITAHASEVQAGFDGPMRYRGIEQLFQKFETQPR